MIPRSRVIHCSALSRSDTRNLSRRDDHLVSEHAATAHTLVA
jgi:hypothetical protein